MGSSQNHKAVPPQLPEDATAAELPDPAGLLRLLDPLVTLVLDPLTEPDQNRGTERREEEEKKFFL